MTHSTTAACDYMEGDSEEGRGEEVPGASWEISRQHDPLKAQLRHGSWLPERSLHESFITQESLKTSLKITNASDSRSICFPFFFFKKNPHIFILILGTVVRNNSFKTLGTKSMPALSSHDQVIYLSKMVFVGVLR